MIKFFRKIRQNLLIENKTGKYLKYATGEIVLVVIGILIALQINNWNQHRLDKIQVNGYLKNLIIDLKSDIIQYDSNIEGYESGYENNNRILRNNDYKKLDVDSINDLIIRYWNLNRTSDQTYQKIKNAGLLEMLGTNEINKAVNDYYNLSISHYDYLINWDKELSQRDGYFWDYNDKYESGTPGRFKSSSLPFKDDSFKRKEELIKLIESTLGRNYLRNAIARDEYGLLIVNDIKSKATKIIELIEKEIDNK